MILSFEDLEWIHDEVSNVDEIMPVVSVWIKHEDGSIEVLKGEVLKGEVEK